jgi:molecular chaperone HscB
VVTNPFELFGLPAQFALDLKVLEQRYRDLARMLHPDRYVRASSAERQAALTRAVDVNEAYATLRDELSRATTLLHLAGRAYDAETTSQSDPEFLMTVMEIREALVTARDAGDDARIAALSFGARAEERRVREALAAALDQKQWLRAEQELGKLRYYHRFREEVRDIEEEREARSG